MVFGKGSLFGGQDHQLISGVQFPSQEKWFAKNEIGITMGVGHEVSAFDKGYLAVSFVSPSGIESVTADCEKF